MTIHDAEKWKVLAELYEKTFSLYISLSSKIQDNMFPEIVNISNEPISNVEISLHVESIQETTREIHQKISDTAEHYGKRKLDAYETAGQMYEEVGDLKNAVEMYSYSYDYCLDKSMELYEKIAKTREHSKNMDTDLS